MIFLAMKLYNFKFRPFLQPSSDLKLVFKNIKTKEKLSGNVKV